MPDTLFRSTGLMLFCVVLSGCSQMGSSQKQEVVENYSFSSEKLCPAVERAIGAAQNRFQAIVDSGNAGGTARTRVWNDVLDPAADQAANCRLLEVGAGVRNLLCEVPLPNAASTLNWQRSLADALQDCLAAQGTWHRREFSAAPDAITVFRSETKQPNFALRGYRNDRGLGQGGWTGILAVGDEFLGQPAP